MEPINRRSFARRMGGAAAAVLPAFAANAKSPNDTIRIAVIGARGRGKDHIRHFAKVPGVSIEAVCDVDERLWDGASKVAEEATGRKPRMEADIRRLLEDKNIDAVSIATPNHWHALAAIWACQAGKDVYVEKPVSHDISEGRKIVEAARKYNRVVAAGTQHRSSESLQQAMELLHSGKLGKIYMARCVVFRPRERIEYTRESAIPAGVHYDLWLGPAPWRPFRLSRFHYNWHWFWDTGNGETGNNGPHYSDVARWGLQKYEHPRKIFSSGSIDGFETDQETPNTQLSIYEYADGTRMQMDVRGLYTNDEDGMGMGVFFYGSEGWMRTGVRSFSTFFGRKNEPGPKADETKPPQPDPHFTNFIQCVRSRKSEDLRAEILEGHLSTSICHLGNIAYRTGRALKFDSASETFPGDAEANSYLSSPGRYPFRVPDKV